MTRSLSVLEHRPAVKMLMIKQMIGRNLNDEIREKTQISKLKVRPNVRPVMFYKRGEERTVSIRRRGGEDPHDGLPQ